MKVNKNLIALHKAYTSGKRGIILEGGSRSGKTWSCIDFIIWYCTNNEGKVINIIRETYKSFKTTLYNDLNRRLPMFGIPSPFELHKEINTFFMFNNRINFIGADNPSKLHGAGCDIFWINEAIDVSKAIFDQLEMRCREFWFIDYNPKYTEHWIYDTLFNRDDTDVLVTTMLDNPFISPAERSKILSYEPTEENIKRGTADEYSWKVYGKGERAAPVGQIFKNVKWIDKFPKNLEKICFGLDFGYTMSPTALVKVGFAGKDIYLELLLYEPIDNPETLYARIAPHVKDFFCWADPSGNSGGRGMITFLHRKGLKVLPANTYPGSIKYGIALMKAHRLNIVRNPHAEKEYTGYIYREINGIRTDEPIDDNNHFWDAARMAIMSQLPRN